MQHMSDAMEQLGPLGDEIAPLFITVDPDRDTPEQMKVYLENFDPRTLGLTGTHEQIKAAIKSYRIYSKKVVTEDAIDFDHSAMTFFMDREGNYVAHFNYGVTGDDMASKIRAIFAKREPEKVSAASVKE
jgi:protein SCO1/2